MIEQDSRIYCFSNKLLRVLLLSLEEIIGRTGLYAVLNRADLKTLVNSFPPNNLERGIPFSEISDILVSIEELYGSSGGRGLILRSGRIFSQIGIKAFADELGMTNNKFRLLPLDQKILTGLNAWAQLFNLYSDQKVMVDDSTERILWIKEICPYCFNRATQIQTCYFEVGILQETLYWISGGKYFNVDETKCIAMGDPTCTIAIAKTFLE